jgi:DNA-binding CsgD family transcriptional regulator
MGPHSPELEELLLALHAALDVESFWKATAELAQAAAPRVAVAVCLRDLDLARPVIVRRSDDEDWPAPRTPETGAAWPVTELPPELRRVPVARLSASRSKPGSGEGGKRVAEVSALESGGEVLVLPFWKRDRLLATICVRRAPEQGGFSKTEVRLLKQLYIYFKLALHRLERLHRHRLARAAAEQLLHRIPLAVLLLDWDLKVIYSNDPARESCILWNGGKKKAMPAEQTLRVPAVLLKECRRWRERWYAEMLEREKSGGGPQTIHHPKAPQWRADIHLVYRQTGNTAKPVFRIQFEDGGSAQAESGEFWAANLAQLVRLTPRERELVQLVCEGASNKEIAGKLFRSEATVKKQLNTLFKKLGVSSRGRLIALARSGSGMDRGDGARVCPS